MTLPSPPPDGDFVRIVEAGPRDGLQNEKTQVATADKVALIDRLSRTGLLTIEATSFVSPKWVPQLADAAEVFSAIQRRPGTAYPVLVPNETGYDRARAVGVEEVAVFTAASEAFNQKNINASIDASIERFRPVLARAAADGVKVRGYVSTVPGCPYQGAVPLADVVRVAKRLHALGCYEISLAATIGLPIGSKVAARSCTIGRWREPDALPERSEKNFLTIRSSSEWKVTTTSRPPGLSACSAANSAWASSPSSSLTKTRSAWKTRVAG